jgi:hypothetical protein
MPEGVRKSLEAGAVFGFFALLTAIGAAVLALAVNDFAQARSSRSWTEVEGVVLSPRAGEAHVIRYAYVAGGRAHEGTRTRFATAGLLPAKIARKAPGEPVEVLVDPENPRAAVLQPGGSALVFALFVLTSGALIFLGLGGMIRTLINGREALAAS